MVPNHHFPITEFKNVAEVKNNLQSNVAATRIATIYTIKIRIS